MLSRHISLVVWRCPPFALIFECNGHFIKEKLLNVDHRQLKKVEVSNLWMDDFKSSIMAWLPPSQHRYSPSGGTKNQPAMTFQHQQVGTGRRFYSPVGKRRHWRNKTSAAAWTALQTLAGAEKSTTGWQKKSQVLLRKVSPADSFSLDDWASSSESECSSLESVSQYWTKYFVNRRTSGHCILAKIHTFCLFLCNYLLTSSTEVDFLSLYTSKSEYKQSQKLLRLKPQLSATNWYQVATTFSTIFIVKAF